MMLVLLRASRLLRYSGYHIATITANGGSVTVTNPAVQTYQFAALSAAGTLTATYAANTVQYQDYCDSGY